MGVGDAWLRSKTDPEVKKVKVLLVLLGVWLVTGFKSCQEIRYSLSGETATASVVKVSPDPEMNPGTQKFTITYRWQDAKTGETRQAMTTSRMEGRNIPPAFEIVYLPGKESSSMPAAARSWVWPTLFFGSTATAIGGVCLLAWRIGGDPRASGGSIRSAKRSR